MHYHDGINGIKDFDVWFFYPFNHILGFRKAFSIPFKVFISTKSFCPGTIDPVNSARNVESLHHKNIFHYHTVIRGVDLCTIVIGFLMSMIISPSPRKKCPSGRNNSRSYVE